MNYRKGVLPTDWYPASITTYETDKNKFTLVWTIDRGEYSWRHIKRTFILPEEDYKIEDMCRSIGFEQLESSDSDWYGEQFIGLRARLSVERHIDGKFIKNTIIEYAPVQMEPEFNVLIEQTGEHFFENKKGRELPF